MTDSAGELKVAIGIDLDQGQVKSENERAADQVESIWAKAAERMKRRMEEAAQPVTAAAALGPAPTRADPLTLAAAAQDRAAAGRARAAAANAAVQQRSEDALAAAAKKAGEEWREMGTRIAGAALAAAAAFGVFAHSVYESALSIDRQARSLGVSTDEIQRMRYAAEQAGLEGNDLGEAMGALAQRAQNASENGGDAAKQLRELGFAFEDANGHVLPANELLASAADALKAIPAGTERTAAAIQLFGEKGRLLLPVLEGGREGLARLGAEFDELGGGLDEETIASVRDAEREFGRLKIVLTESALPAIRALTTWAREASETMRRFRVELSESSPAGDRARLAIVGITTALGYLAVAYGIAKGAAIRAAFETAKAWVVAAWPFALVVAGIAAVVLAVDELITTFNGGDTVIRRVVDAMLGVGTTQGLVEDLKGGLLDFWAAWEELGGGVDGILADMEESFDSLVNTIANGINRTLEVAAVAAQAAGLDTSGTPLSAEAIVRRRQEQTQSVLDSAASVAARRRSASDADRRADAIRAGRDAYATGNLGAIPALQGTGALLQATPSQAFRFDQTPGTTVNANTRAQVNVTMNGLVDPGSDALRNAMSGAAEEAFARVNDSALETIGKSRGRRGRG